MRIVIGKISITLWSNKGRPYTYDRGEYLGKLHIIRLQYGKIRAIGYHLPKQKDDEISAICVVHTTRRENQGEL